MNQKAVGCRWVFTLKHKANGSIDRYKARLVAKGYTQTYRVDYLETFAPVAKLNTVLVLLSLAANRDWPLLQFDVKNVFLHGDLNKKIYMDLPSGVKSKKLCLGLVPRPSTVGWLKGCASYYVEKIVERSWVWTP
ncbi:transposable element gene [Prunus dulcis]|uniref:Transposable element protein n=1 Tax=Prunus dulcis TaxID=3755 RepID=A0A4Y1QXM8_PRUDU|nr:transposable element gene [Prunus dulcis]